MSGRVAEGGGDSFIIRVLVAPGHVVNDYDGRGYDLPPRARAA
jgi:hypothetical protein